MYKLERLCKAKDTDNVGTVRYQSINTRTTRKILSQCLVKYETILCRTKH